MSCPSTGIDGSKIFKQKVMSWDKMMSDSRNEYYEAIVHPALLLHDNPRRIVIMNDISGGILCEVLKYSMVKEVIFMIPNAEIVSLVGEYSGKWNACYSFLANVTSRYDDSRVQIHYYDDLTDWFHKSVDNHIDVFFADATMYVSTGPIPAVLIPWCALFH
jgi:spermidine synthase